jgi:hypothetical protein
MMKIIITKHPIRKNYYTVETNEKFCEGLTWDEMLGQIAYITCPKGNGWTEDSLFRMKSTEETTAQP